MSCPYSDIELAYWDGVCNPMGDACNSCEEHDCEHNLNGPDEFGPFDAYFEPSFIAGHSDEYIEPEREIE